MAYLKNYNSPLFFESLQFFFKIQYPHKIKLLLSLFKLILKVMKKLITLFIIISFGFIPNIVSADNQNNLNAFFYYATFNTPDTLPLAKLF